MSILSDLYYNIKYHLILLEWKRRAHKRQRPHVRIGGIPRFFEELTLRGVPYVVLRWFHEIPLTPQQEKEYTDADIDMLADADSLLDVCRTVARHPGNVKLDIRSNGLILGTDIKRYPYYPPALARELLTHRIQTPEGIYRPDDKHYLRSLAYHLVYQKGLKSALPTGMPGLENQETSRHDAVGTLRAIAEKTGDTLPDEITLLSLHLWLKANDWNMPYDLLPRWPVRNAWHDAIFKYESDILRNEMGDKKDLFVFLIREDADKAGATAEIITEIGEQFQIIDNIRLTPEQQLRVIRRTRGGDWTKRKQTRLFHPVTAIICHDQHPIPLTDPVLKHKVPLATNGNVAFKPKLRQKLAAKYPDALDFMHGSDNDLESFEYMKAIYGDNWHERWNAISKW